VVVSDSAQEGVGLFGHGRRVIFRGTVTAIWFFTVHFFHNHLNIIIEVEKYGVHKTTANSLSYLQGIFEVPAPKMQPATSWLDHELPVLAQGSPVATASVGATEAAGDGIRRDF
jgi:hypothetical protein